VPGFATLYRSTVLAAILLISAALTVTGTSVAGAQAAPAHAANSATQWTKISGDTALGIASAGLFRTGDGRMHVVWSSHDGGTNYSLHYSTVGGREKLLATGTIKSHWSSMSFFPRLVAGPKGGIRLVFSGADNVSGSPYNTSAMYTATSNSAGKSWTLATGGLSHSGVPATDLAAADEPNGTPIAAWSEVSSLAYHVGIDPKIPATAPDQHLGIGAAGGLVDPTLIKTKSGAIVAGWFNNSGNANAGYWAAQIWPTRQPKVKAPNSGSLNQVNGQPFEPVALVARQGGGNYFAYCVPTHVRHCGHIALWRVGAAKAVTVPGSSSGAATFVAMSADRGGHLWVAWFDTGTNKISVVRTNAAANGFGQVRTISAPPKLFDLLGLGAEGSAGPLDLLALEAQNNHTPAWFDTQLDPALRIRASKSSVSNTQSTTITFTVVDAGDAVAGAKVTFLGKTATTNSKGVVKFTVKKGTAKGKHIVVATKSGYASATFTVKVT
jgi:hypothetical protein